MRENGRCDKIEIMTDISRFFRRVGLIYDYRKLEWLGFHLKDNLIGSFGEDDLKELLDFCGDNPEYHIVTVTHPGRYVNELIRGNDLYILADGDANPHLILNPFFKKDMDSVMEEMFDKTLAIAHKMDSSGE